MTAHNTDRAQIAALASLSETPWERVVRENRQLRERVAELEAQIAGLESAASKAIGDMHEALRRYVVAVEQHTRDDAEVEQI